MPTTTIRMGVGIPVLPGDNVQAKLDANPNGASFSFAPGTYRLESALNPKTGQRLFGNGQGVILTGAKLLTGWTQSGSDWFATRAGTTGSKPDDPGDGQRCAITGCENPHDVFYNGAPLVRVASQGALATGKFWEDFTNSRVYIRDNPNGNTVEQAFSEKIIESSNSEIQIRNFVIEMAANPAQEGAVEALGDDWIIANNEVRYNHGHGIHTEGDRIVVSRNKIHHQMQMGIGSNAGDNLTIEYNEIYNNNRDNSYLHLWEAGGSKWAFTKYLHIRGNWCHDNFGPGLWPDINNGACIIEDNYVHDNNHYGIFYEISYGEIVLGDGKKTYIRNNVSFDNYDTSPTGFFSGGQICVSGSRDCEVYNNTVRGQDGIGGLAQLRTDHTDSRGSHQLHNLHVYDNQIEAVWDGVGFCNIAGIQTDDANQTNGVYTSQGNSFTNNDYFRASGIDDSWTWINDFNTFAQWQSAGQDAAGSVTVDGHVTIPGTPTLNAGPIA